MKIKKTNSKFSVENQGVFSKKCEYLGNTCITDPRKVGSKRVTSKIIFTRDINKNPKHQYSDNLPENLRLC